MTAKYRRSSKKCEKANFLDETHRFYLNLRGKALHPPLVPESKKKIKKNRKANRTAQKYFQHATAALNLHHSECKIENLEKKNSNIEKMHSNCLPLSTAFCTYHDVTKNTKNKPHQNSLPKLQQQNANERHRNASKPISTFDKISNTPMLHVIVCCDETRCHGATQFLKYFIPRNPIPQIDNYVSSVLQAENDTAVGGIRNLKT